MLLYVTPKVSRPFNPCPMYVILCFWLSMKACLHFLVYVSVSSWYSFPFLWLRPNISYSMLLKESLSFDPTKRTLFPDVSYSTCSLSPAPMCVFIYIDKVSCTSTYIQFMLLYVPDRDQRPSYLGPMYVILSSWNFILPIQWYPSVCYYICLL